MDIRFLIFLFIVALAVYAALRMAPKSPKDGLGKLLGYVLVFVILVALGTTALPRFLAQQAGNMGNWDPLWNRTTTAVNSLTDAAAGLVGMDAPDIPAADISRLSTPAATPAPDTPTRYTVQRGDTLAAIAAQHGLTVPDLQAANGLAGDAIYAGQILLIPPATAVSMPTTTALEMAVAPTLSPTTTTTAVAAAMPITLTLQADYYRQLVTARAAGDSVSGETAVAALLALDPDDLTALTANDELRQAQELAARFDALANVTDAAQVKGVLYGRTFTLLDDGANTWKSACAETATLQQVTAGWLRGYTFTVRRCVLSGYGDRTPASGDTFTVK